MKKEHKWAAYFGPRNRRVSIQACEVCGVAKGIINEPHECKEIDPSQHLMRMRGWMTEDEINALEQNQL